MFDLTPIFVLAIIFGTILAIVYLGIRRKERMAMMEKGVDASIFLAPKKRSSMSLKYGLLLIGVALGIIIGKLLALTEAFMYEEEAAYFSMIFLFGGLALIIHYFLDKRMVEEEKRKTNRTE